MTTNPEMKSTTLVNIIKLVGDEPVEIHTDAELNKIADQSVNQTRKNLPIFTIGNIG